MGAWIETAYWLKDSERSWVAPYVGAWIETAEHYALRLSGSSHPMWVRGLKLSIFAQTICFIHVAPYVGAWIETKGMSGMKKCSPRSHPMWVRGLKQALRTRQAEG